MSSRPSFRPRPIDSSKPLPIVRTSKDLRHEDDIVVSRALPAVGTGVEAAELEERHLQQALMASVFGDDPSNKADIPVPVVREVQPPSMGGKKPFLRPNEHYIMFDRSDADLEDSMVDYDADHEDEAFVVRYNTAHKKSSSPLTVDALEQAIDLLEKLQGRATAEAEEELSATNHKASHKLGVSGGKDGKTDKPRQDTAENLLSYGNVRQELASLLQACSDSGRREIHAHWVARRVAHGKPFHRLYAKPPRVDDPNPAVAFRPRGREDGAAAGRRMNTYDNYKRAALLRDEFRALETVMNAVLAREEAKAEHLALRALQMRLQCVADGGARLESVSRGIVASERECYSIGAGPSAVVVSCRGLGDSLPPGIAESFNRIPFVPEKTRLKKKKIGTLSSGAGAAPGSNAASSVDTRVPGGNAAVGAADAQKGRVLDPQDSRAPLSSSAQQFGVDSYGFDDHGNRFLKHMRYFAGGFMNYGVSPYDHRVFAAASERNTVKDHPSEPRPFMFPNPSVPFVANGGTTGGKVRPCSATTPKPLDAERPDVPRIQRAGAIAGKLGPLPTAIAKKGRRQVKVRARVGRGGRIVLDRVAFEPERGVKAASYPASVEMGGVYSAGLPLEAVPKVLSEGFDHGALGSLARLGPRRGSSLRERRLFQELRPMLALADGQADGDGRVSYWPSRRQARLRLHDLESAGFERELEMPPTSRRLYSERSSHEERLDQPSRAGLVYTEHGEPVYRVPCTEERLRELPAYALRDRPLVSIVDSG